MAHDHHPRLAGYADYFAAAPGSGGATLVPEVDAAGEHDMYGGVGLHHHHQSLPSGVEMFGLRGFMAPSAAVSVAQSKQVAVDEDDGSSAAISFFRGEQQQQHRQMMSQQLQQAPLSLSLHGPPPDAASASSFMLQHQLGGEMAWQLQGAGAGWHLRGSRFLLPTQQLLQEFCSIPAETTDDTTTKAPKRPAQEEHPQGGGSSSSTSWPAPSAQIQAMDAAELQRLKAKLYTMLEEVDRRYRRYREQMRAVAGSFEAAAGRAAAAAYTRTAARTISKHFRTLRDGVAAQARAVRVALGEKVDAAAPPGMTKGETPRLRELDQCLRQHKAYQSGVLESQPWRPQRGLPERAVSVLRAWLFEHFLHPYPSDVDKHILARQTGLSRSQVSNWFINARVRLWKPMVEEMYAEEMKDKEEGSGGAGDQQYSAQLHASSGDQLLGNHNTAAAGSYGGGGEQKPTRAQLHDAGSLASVVSIGRVHQQQQSQSLDFGMSTMDDDGFDAYDAGGVHGFGGNGGAVSLTLGLQHQHADPSHHHHHGGVNVAAFAAASASPSTSSAAAHGGGAAEFLFMAGEQHLGGQFGAGVMGGAADAAASSHYNHHRGGVLGATTGFHLLRDLAVLWTRTTPPANIRSKKGDEAIDQVTARGINRVPHSPCRHTCPSLDAPRTNEQNDLATISTLIPSFSNWNRRSSPAGHCICDRSRRGRRRNEGRRRGRRRRRQAPAGAQRHARPPLQGQAVFFFPLRRPPLRRPAGAVPVHGPRRGLASLQPAVLSGDGALRGGRQSQKRLLLRRVERLNDAVVPWRPFSSLAGDGVRGRGAHGAAPHRVRHRRVVGAVGEPQGVHQAVVAPRTDARVRVDGQARVGVLLQELPHGAPGHHGELRHVQVPLHARRRQPVRTPHLPHRLRELPPRAPRGAVVRDGRRRHGVPPGEPGPRAVALRPHAALLHRVPLREPHPEPHLLLRHGVRRRRVRHQPRPGGGAGQDAGRVPAPVPGAVRQRRPDPRVHVGARGAADEAPGVPPVRPVGGRAGPAGGPPGGPAGDAAPPGLPGARVPDDAAVAGRGAEEALRRAGQAGLGGRGPAVGVLRRGAPVDGVRVVGVRGHGGARGAVAQGDGDARQVVPQLVPAGRLHGLLVQHAARGEAAVPEAARVLHAGGAPGAEEERHHDGHGVRAAPRREAAALPVAHRRPRRAPRPHRRPQEARPRPLEKVSEEELLQGGVVADEREGPVDDRQRRRVQGRRVRQGLRSILEN